MVTILISNYELSIIYLSVKYYITQYEFGHTSKDMTTIMLTYVTVDAIITSPCTVTRVLVSIINTYCSILTRKGAARIY